MGKYTIRCVRREDDGEEEDGEEEDGEEEKDGDERIEKSRQPGCKH